MRGIVPLRGSGEEDDVMGKGTMGVAGGRPARWIWSLVLGALMPAACAERTSNSDATTPPVITGHGVEITRIERSEPRRTVRATVSTHGVEQCVTLAPLPDGPSPGFTAVIEDGDSFFELSLAADEASGEIWIRERTSVDEMTMMLRQHRGRVFEQYEINGNAMSFDHAVLDPGQIEKALGHYRAGQIGSAATPEMRELGEVLAAFDAYYTPTMINTLHDNAAGDLLVSLLEDPVFAGVVTGGDPSPDRVDGTVARLCWLAARCTALKCMFGGPSNAICVRCSGTVIGCAILELWCWWRGCDCCF
jgi:hypothetical protein